MKNDKLRKGERLGSGAYGIVYKAEDKVGNNLAVKRLLVDDTSTFIGSVREADLVSRFKHPHVVSTIVKYGTPFTGPLSPVDRSMGSVKDDNVTFIMEQASCNVYEFFKKSRTLRDVKTVLVHVLLALEYMHGKGVSHQDIKPQNILCFGEDHPFTFKLSDLGLAFWNNRYGYQSPTISTSWYRAPEVAYGGIRYSSLVDIWSVGCMMYEFIFGTPLLQHVTEDRNDTILLGYKNLIPGCGGSVTWDSFWNKKCKYNYSNSGSADIHYMRSFFEGLMAYDPLRRFTATAALNHPFLFIEYGSYINSVRMTYPPIPDPSQIITIPNVFERRFGVGTAYNILQCRYQELSDDNFRTLFHAMMLFDRALAKSAEIQSPRYTYENERHGLYWSHDGTVVRFMVCYYIMYKYFRLLQPNVRWSDLLVEKYSTPEFIQLAEQFEKYVVVDVCDYKLYNATPLDIAGNMGVKLNNNDMHDLFKYYTTYSWVGVTSEIILDSFLRSRDNQQ